MHTRMQRAAAKVQREERQKEERKVKRGGEDQKKPLLPGLNYISCSKWTYPSLPCCFATFWMAPPFCCEEETASYLHQITFLYTPPHWPYHGAYPENGAQRSHSRRPRPSQVSVEHNRGWAQRHCQKTGSQKRQRGDTAECSSLKKRKQQRKNACFNCTRVNTHRHVGCCCTYRYIHIFRRSFHLKSEQNLTNSDSFIIFFSFLFF